MKDPRFRLPFVAVLFLFLPVQRQAEALELLVVFPPGAQPAPYEIVATSPSREEKVFHQDGKADGNLALELDTSLPWEVEVRSAGFWATPLTIAKGENHGGPYEISLTATGQVEFKAELGEPASVPELSFSPSQKSSTRPEALSQISKSACRPEENRFVCEVPRGRWDLKIGFEGRVPKYLWEVEIEAQARMDLGKLSFREGGSIAGYVVGPGLNTSGCRIDVSPSGPSADEPGSAHRADLNRFSATSDERGFFQVSGLPPGHFRLQASLEVWPPTVVTPIAVVEGTETRLREVVEVGPPPRMEVELIPPTDPEGTPWTVELLESYEGSNVARSAAKSDAGTEGNWSTEKAHAGSWRLVVTDRHDNRWLEREFSWIPLDPPLVVEINHLAIRGQVRIGDEPVTTGSAIFGTSFGDRSLRLDLDERGRFEGFLPSGGMWKVELTEGDSFEHSRVFGPFEIRKRPGKSYAEVDLILPDTHLAGRVVRDGKGVVGARLTVLRYPEKGRRDAFGRSGEDGKFLFEGLEPGSILVQAAANGAESEWTPVELAEENEAEIELELKTRRVVQGQISWTGGVLPGASLVALFSTATSPRAMQRAISRFDGTFAISIPSAAKSVTILAAASGFDLEIQEFHLPESDTPPILIEAKQTGGLLTIRGDVGLDAELITEQGSLLIRDFWTFLADRVQSGPQSMSIKGLPGGYYRLCTGAGAKPPCTGVTVQAGNVAELEWKTE